MTCVSVKRFIVGQLEFLPNLTIIGSSIGYLGAHVLNIVNLDASMAAIVPLAASPAFASFTVVSFAVGTIVYNFKIPSHNKNEKRKLIKDIIMLIPSVTVMLGVYTILNGLTGGQLLLINGVMLVAAVISAVIVVIKMSSKKLATTIDFE